MSNAFIKRQDKIPTGYCENVTDDTILTGGIDEKSIVDCRVAAFRHVVLQHASSSDDETPASAPYPVRDIEILYSYACPSKRYGLNSQRSRPLPPRALSARRKTNGQFPFGRNLYAMLAH
jgi:hypothetical protein